jgi:hypothetical protein
MKKALIVMAAVLVVAGGLGFFVTSGGTSGDSATTNAGPQEMLKAPMPMSSPALAVQADAREMEAVYSTDSVGGSGTGSSVANVDALPPGGVDARIIRTADLSIEVEKSGFQDAFERAQLVAQKYAGYVASSSVWGEKSKSGNLLLRVPSKSYESAMADLSGLGTIDAQSSDSQEVTDQFIDLNARLRTWQAQQNVLLRLMEDANSIAETMTVQRELQQVQFQIEQIKGQLRVLRDQTAYATIAVEIHEPGAVKPVPGTDKPSLTALFQQALAGFLSIVSLVIVGLGYLIPISLIALVAWLVVRRLTTRTAKVGAV